VPEPLASKVELSQQATVRQECLNARLWRQTLRFGNQRSLQGLREFRMHVRILARRPRGRSLHGMPDSSPSMTA
jgi:hypothetical protein